MSERRFYIAVNDGLPIENCIDILLHGEGKEEPDPWEEWIITLASIIKHPGAFLEEAVREHLRKMPRRK